MMKIGPKTVADYLREAEEAIEEFYKRKSQPDKIFYITFCEVTLPVHNNNHADLAETIMRGANALLHDRIERTRDGGVIIRRGVNPYCNDGPRARLFHRLHQEALIARGVIDIA